MMFVSSDYDAEAYVCLKTGELFWTGDEMVYDFGENPLPDDLDDPKKYISVPDKRDLDLGTNLVFEFADRYVPDRYDEIRAMFRKKGAYARLKDLLERCGKLEQWYEFSDSEERRVLLEWCKENGLEVLDEGIA